MHNFLTLTTGWFELQWKYKDDKITPTLNFRFDRLSFRNEILLFNAGFCSDGAFLQINHFVKRTLHKLHAHSQTEETRPWIALYKCTLLFTENLFAFTQWIKSCYVLLVKENLVYRIRYMYSIAVGENVTVWWQKIKGIERY